MKEDKEGSKGKKEAKEGWKPRKDGSQGRKEEWMEGIKKDR